MQFGLHIVANILALTAAGHHLRNHNLYTSPPFLSIPPIRRLGRALTHSPVRMRLRRMRPCESAQPDVDLWRLVLFPPHWAFCWRYRCARNMRYLNVYYNRYYTMHSPVLIIRRGISTSAIGAITKLNYTYNYAADAQSSSAPLTPNFSVRASTCRV